MEKIAFIIGETFLYWNSLILMLACAAAIGLFLFFYLRKRGNGLSAAILVPLSVAFSLVLSRAVHWYCRADAYSSFSDALTDFTGGGYALAGVFAGCILAAVLLRLLRVVKNLPMALDCMALAGCAGICVGRLACFYTPADRGILLENIRSLPLAWPVVNSVTGEVQWRLATFVLQSICAGLIFLALSIWYLTGQRGKKRKVRDGDAALLFLTLYGATQVLLDSTRYDSLFLRSNGFVSLVQILAAAGLIIPGILFSVRLVRRRRFRWWYVPVWTVFLALAGGAGFMEYWVQRHGDQVVFSYGVMGACLGLMVVMVCLLRRLAGKKRETTY